MRNVVIVLIILLVIFILGMGFFMFYMFSPAGAAFSNSVKKDEVIGYNTGSEFITTLKNSNRVIKTDIVIEVQNKKDERKLSEYNYRVRDCILTILGNIAEEEIKREDFKDELKAQIKDALQEMLEIDSIKGIYFNEFVIH